MLGRSVALIATHYELLGVPVTATADEVRRAYRARARTLHPDQSGHPDPAGGHASMAALNEAYRILRDPKLRSRYDADLRMRGSAAPSVPRATTFRAAAYVSTPAVDPTPARYPWKLAAGMAVLGVTVVLVGAALYEPAGPDRPDNVLQPGSCVELLLNNDVREVTCNGENDLVVATLVPFEESCPSGLSAYRDRQGMGIACVAPSEP